MEKIENEIVEILQKYTFNKDVWKDFNVNSKITSDLKINSARIVDIILDIEEKYEIEIEDKLLDKIKTIGDMKNVINNKLQ
ncbi:MAG: phosphopantetheine-binding protein [Bacteroidales bacterium]|jgi:acyl carrier protein|nr:acyl carrier protein [Bacteroidales bacterium]